MKNFNALDHKMQSVIKYIVQSVIDVQNTEQDIFITSVSVYSESLNRIVRYLTPDSVSNVNIDSIPLNIRDAVSEYIRKYIRFTVL